VLAIVESAMKIYEFLSQSGALFEARDWLAFEAEAQDMAGTLVPEDRLLRIGSVGLDEYVRSLQSMVRTAEGRVSEFEGVEALYWEFDPDNNWASGIDYCASFTREDPDWAADSVGWETGPDLPQFAEIYGETGFSGSPLADGSTVLLFARTLASFGRAYEAEGRGGLPVGAAFHDSDRILMVAPR
jgi:hypothetical protein